MFDYALVFVACFAQLLHMLSGDILLASRGSFAQLKARCFAVLELPLAPLLLSLEIFDEVHGNLRRFNS